MAYSHLNALLILSLFIFRVNGQISTPCTTSVISSFTPCMNYLTGSSGSGSSPTKECCDSLKNLTTDSMDCTCLIVTGNVPVSIPFINRPLAISLPRMCKSSVPLGCKSSGVTLPPPGPALFVPTEAPTEAPIAHAPHAHSHAPHHAHSHAPRAHSPKASKATTVVAAPPPAETPLDITPAAPPEVSLAPTANPGIRPVLTPSSASKPTSIVSLSFLLQMLVGIMVLRFF